MAHGDEPRIKPARMNPACVGAMLRIRTVGKLRAIESAAMNAVPPQNESSIFVHRPEQAAALIGTYLRFAGQRRETNGTIEGEETPCHDAYSR